MKSIPIHAKYNTSTPIITILITFQITELLFVGENKLNTLSLKVLFALTLKEFGLYTVSLFQLGSVMSWFLKSLSNVGAIANALFNSVIHAITTTANIFFMLHINKLNFLLFPNRSINIYDIYCNTYATNDINSLVIT